MVVAESIRKLRAKDIRAKLERLNRLLTIYENLIDIAASTNNSDLADSIIAMLEDRLGVLEKRVIALEKLGKNVKSRKLKLEIYLTKKRVEENIAHVEDIFLSL